MIDLSTKALHVVVHATCLTSVGSFAGSHVPPVHLPIVPTDLVPPLQVPGAADDDQMPSYLGTIASKSSF